MVSIYIYSLVVGDLSVYHLCIFGMNKDEIRVYYFNNLNSWLGQTMQRDCPQVFYGVLNKHVSRLNYIISPTEAIRVFCR